MKIKNLVAGAIEGLLVGVLEGEGGSGAILPRLGAKVVVEAGASGHGLGVEVGGEGAVLQKTEAHEKLQYISSDALSDVHEPPYTTQVHIKRVSTFPVAYIISDPRAYS